MITKASINYGCRKHEATKIQKRNSYALQRRNEITLQLVSTIGSWGSMTPDSTSTLRTHKATQQMSLDYIE